MPICKRCGKPHYNFISCAEAAAKAAEPVRAPDKFLRPREDSPDFGNRFGAHTGRQFGDTVVTFIPRAAHPMYLKPEPPKEAA